jgi:hypothetical protein
MQLGTARADVLIASKLTFYNHCTIYYLVINNFRLYLDPEWAIRQQASNLTFESCRNKVKKTTKTPSWLFN